VIHYYRRKPFFVQAVQFTGDNVQEIATFINADWDMFEADELVIETLEGDMSASLGDYIVQGVDGEFYPCKPHIFERIHERIEEPV
jgi:hypothetical protein